MPKSNYCPLKQPPSTRFCMPNTEQLSIRIRRAWQSKHIFGRLLYPILPFCNSIEFIVKDIFMLQIRFGICYEAFHRCKSAFAINRPGYGLRGWTSSIRTYKNTPSCNVRRWYFGTNLFLVKLEVHHHHHHPLKFTERLGGYVYEPINLNITVFRSNYSSVNFLFL